MVDDVLAKHKCGPQSSRINQVINTFMESENLTLSENKCHNIHIGKNKERCNELKVHNKTMHESGKEKYLGEIIEKSGNQRATIKDRKSKGYGIVGQIIGITSEAPFGMWRVKSAIQMRNAWLIYSMLYNLEA